VPFKKIASGVDKGKYRSPSGRVMTGAQVRAYYARTGEGSSMPRSSKSKASATGVAKSAAGQARATQKGTGRKPAKKATPRPRRSY